MGNHGLTEDVCPDNYSHMYGHDRTLTHTKTQIRMSVTLNTDIWTKTQTSSDGKDVSLHLLCHCCHGNHRAEIVIFFDCHVPSLLHP